MISRVGPADGRGIVSSLTLHNKGVSADTSCCYSQPAEGLEVESELADIILLLLDGERTGSGAGGREGARVVGVPDVGGVGRDGGAAGRGGDDAANSKPRSTAAGGRSSPGGALRGGVAGALRARGGGVRTLLVRELDDSEERHLIWRGEIVVSSSLS